MILNPAQGRTARVIRSDRTAGQARREEAEAGWLVQRAASTCLADAPGAGFVVRRAAESVARLERGPARQSLQRAVVALEAGAEPDRAALAHALVCFGGVLEGRGEHEDAAAAYEAALRVRPDCVETVLHAARAWRKSGAADRARALYRRAGGGDCARLGLFSTLGVALLAPDTATAIGEVIEAARLAGEREVEAVALEERALVRRGERRWAEAVADLTAAGLCHPARRDRVRVAHLLADVVLARGDVEAAREALSAALDESRARERGRAVERLRAVARLQGDQLGLRRWPAGGAGATLVSLMPARIPDGASLAPAIRRWRDALSGTASA